MKKIIKSVLTITFLALFLLIAGFIALTTSKPAISETPKIKIQRNQVQELETSEPNQLIELMAKDLHEKQVKARTIMKEAVGHLDDAPDAAPSEAPSEVKTQNAEDNAQEAAATEETTPTETTQVAQNTIVPTRTESSFKKIEALRAAAQKESKDYEDDVEPELLKKSPKHASASTPWLKTSISLVFVLSLIGVVATLAKKYLPQAQSKIQGNYHTSIQVLQNMTLGLKQQIMVILVEGHRLVIGVSDQNMNLLYAIPQSENSQTALQHESVELTHTPPAPSPVMERMTERKVETKTEKFAEKSPEKLVEKFIENNADQFEDSSEELAKVVTHAPQNQFSDHDFRKKLEAFERYQSDQAHIASLREKVREQMAAFSQRRETGEPVSSNVSDKIRSVMRSMKSFNSLNQQQGNQERGYGRDYFQKTA